MRIIAGRLGGRHFNPPHGHVTHPMSDRARGALFNMLGDLAGLQILDAFAGSGALSFEAISRGAEQVLAIERDKSAIRSISEAIRELGVQSSMKLIQAGTHSWLATNPDRQFGIVLCDPPYDDLQPSLLVQLAARVEKGGLLVLSWPAGQEPPTFNGLNQIERRTYAGAQLIFYRAE